MFFVSVFLFGINVFFDFFMIFMVFGFDFGDSSYSIFVVVVWCCKEFLWDFKKVLFIFNSSLLFSIMSDFFFIVMMLWMSFLVGVIVVGSWFIMLKKSIKLWWMVGLLGVSLSCCFMVWKVSSIFFFWKYILNVSEWVFMVLGEWFWSSLENLLVCFSGLGMWMSFFLLGLLLICFVGWVFFLFCVLDVVVVNVLFFFVFFVVFFFVLVFLYFCCIFFCLVGGSFVKVVFLFFVFEVFGGELCSDS